MDAASFSSSASTHGPPTENKAAPSSSSSSSSASSLLTPPYSFATNLLGAFGAVKKKNTHTLEMLQELATVVKSRSNVEEEYAKQLTRIVANHNNALVRLGESLARKAIGSSSSSSSSSFSSSEETAAADAAGIGTLDNTFRDCIERFKADMLNKAEQRKQLAISMSMEVFGPIEEMYNQLAAQSKELEDKTAGLSKQAKGLETRYRGAYKQYEAAVRQATITGNTLVDQGGTMPTLDLQALCQKHMATPRDNTPPPSSPFDLKKEELTNLMAGSPKKFSAALTQVAKTDLTHWLLPSSSSFPLDKDRQQDLYATVREQLEAAELLRFACRDRYEDLVVFARQATHQLQHILCKYQLSEERCVDEMATILRKQVVFESSCLANEQYEAQLIFKVIEAVDKDRDLEAFIHAHKASHPGADVDNVLKSLGLLTSSPLPLPPASFKDMDEEEEGIAHSFHNKGAIVLQTQDLPNLSSPAPHVVPAATVLRLLREGGSASRNHSPPLLSPPTTSPVPIAVALPPQLLPTPTPTSTTTTSSQQPPPRSPLFFHHGTFVTPKQDMDDDEEEDDEEEDKGQEDDEEEEEDDDDDEGFSSPSKGNVPTPVSEKRRAEEEVRAADGAGKEFIL